MIPIGKSGLGGIKGVITSLVVIGPICFGEPGLHFTTLTAGRDRTRGRIETDLQVKIGAAAGWTECDEGAGHVIAAAADGGVITEESLPDRAFAGVPITDLQLAERHTAASLVDNIEVGLDLVITGVGVRRSILDSQCDRAAGSISACGRVGREAGRLRRGTGGCIAGTSRRVGAGRGIA